MAMSEYEAQKFIVLEQSVAQLESVLGQVIEELRASKLLKAVKKE